MLNTCYQNTRRSVQTMTVTTESCVVSRSETTRTYPCGHEGPSLWSLKLFGNIHPVPNAAIATTDKCGQCHLESALPQLTQCAECGVAIRPKQPCFREANTIRCASKNCSTGPNGGAQSGKWTGTAFEPNSLITGGAEYL